MNLFTSRLNTELRLEIDKFASARSLSPRRTEYWRGWSLKGTKSSVNTLWNPGACKQPEAWNLHKALNSLSRGNISGCCTDLFYLGVCSNERQRRISCKHIKSIPFVSFVRVLLFHYFSVAVVQWRDLVNDYSTINFYYFLHFRIQTCELERSINLSHELNFSRDTIAAGNCFDCS